MTAEEILIKNGILSKPLNESGNFPLNLTRDTHIQSAKDIKRTLIEFAKFHVKAALKEVDDEMERRGVNISQAKVFQLYPLENIK